MLISLILKLYATASCPKKGVDLSTHFIYLYKKAKEINTSGRLGGVKNDSSNGTRPDPLFSTGAYTASDKRPVEKIAVWPRETSSA